jgi:hypothetical protein
LKRGGDWIPAEVEGDQAEAVRILRIWWKDSLFAPGESKIMPERGVYVDVHSVLFDDSNVWDASIGRLCGVDAGYYEKVRELVGGIGQGE